jgi:predicted dienelactone hydrolase
LTVYLRIRKAFPNASLGRLFWLRKGPLSINAVFSFKVNKKRRFTLFRNALQRINYICEVQRLLKIQRLMKNNVFNLLFWAFSLAQISASAQSTGYTQKTFVDAQRGNRNVPTRIYYPSQSVGQNAAISPSGVFPVVVFAHGFLMSPNDYSALAELIVPQGYIIVQLGTETSLFPSPANFSSDINFVVDAMKVENTTANSLFFNRLNNKFGVGGHSMGGGTSFLAAANNPNISAIFNLAAAANTTPSALTAAANVTCPTLIFAGNADCVTPPVSQQQALYSATAAACKFYIEIAGASHCKYSDAASVCYLGEAGACSGTVTLAQQISVTYTFLAPFLDTYLKNQPTRWADFQTAYTAAVGLSGQQKTTTCVPIIPVELTLFSAKIQENTVQLDWNTASERQNKGFDIERSNAINNDLLFEKIGFVKGNGTTGTPQYFSFLDTKPLSGTAYYRLKQWDTNGQLTLSKVVAVSKKGEKMLRIAPNPIGAEGVIRLQNINNPSIIEANTTGEIVNTMGQVVKKISDLATDIHVGDLPKGVYFLTLKISGREQTLRFVK